MSKHPVSSFLARKDIEVTFQRYAIDALSAMAQGLFASLLIGTILTTVGDLSGLGFFNEIGEMCIRDRWSGCSAARGRP